MIHLIEQARKLATKKGLSSIAEICADAYGEAILFFMPAKCREAFDEPGERTMQGGELESGSMK